MAAKKPKKEKSGNPSIVLVIFLIFFILVTIGLGVGVYYDQDTITKATDDAKKANLSWTSEKNRVKYYTMLALEFRKAAGDKLDPDEILELDGFRTQLAKADGIFKDEKSKEAMEKFVESVKASLGGADADKNPKTTFALRLKNAEDRANNLQADLNAALAKFKRTEDHFGTLADNQANFNKDASARIQKEADRAFASTQARLTSNATSVETHREMIAKYKDKCEELDNEKEQHGKAINRLNAEIAALNKKIGLADGVAGPANTVRTDPFPLVLDISPGKPLWDHPVGRVMRVDPDLRQIAINIGSAQGAKPELTFNIFGPGLSGKAEKQMKGSLEIIRVVDSNTSIARITSLYDADGREIALNDVSRTRVQRETEAPIREGDLLFNLFWGTHVAVAGYVNITGDASDNPAVQIQQMEDFAYLCQRHGMQVDAYVDMRDGKIAGPGITSKTRYLIVGDLLRNTRIEKKKAKDDDDKEMAKDAAGPADRNQLVKEATEMLQKKATANGLLHISAENFATVIGYRRARSANNPEVSRFSPSLPYAGTGAQLRFIDIPRKDEKKEVDKENENKEK